MAIRSNGCGEQVRFGKTGTHWMPYVLQVVIVHDRVRNGWLVCNFGSCPGGRVHIEELALTKNHVNALKQIAGLPGIGGGPTDHCRQLAPLNKTGGFLLCFLNKLRESCPILWVKIAIPFLLSDCRPV